MLIHLNGQALDVADNLTAAELLTQLGLAGKRLALELNREIVPRSTYADTRLQTGDEVEIVHAIGGG
ncbi:sulfur carrier protein ThiS [Plasticicumulans lactativorans]|uniref:Sulfur carrier protein ThiS n=1 Tax=Plasticicumulans lactativorans TaxID=1133106 RepID=A0A4R2KPR5_9GAMM|nr:sulfur carrier protein ThiS [Plasticicumulans lactativorans]TCO75564.1 sulfur carrier protein ThiS [Plasticicumulans lactativorans]